MLAYFVINPMYMKTHVTFLLAFASLFLPHLSQAQWIAASDIPGTNISKIAFADADHGFALAAYSFTGWTQIFHTTDGAQSWDTLHMPVPLGSEIMDIHFCAPDTGFVATRRINNGGMRLFKTFDTGQTWVDISPDTANLGSGLAAVHFSNSTHGCFGVSGKLHSTTDGGQTWSTKTTGQYYIINDIDFADANNGMAGCQDGTFGYMGIVYTTTNGGMTWDSLLLNSYNSSMNNISNPEPGKGYGYKSLFGGQDFLRTSSNWTTFDSLNLPFLDSINYEQPTGVDFRNGTGYLATSYGRILRSTDHGSTWTEDKVDDSLSLDDIEIAGSKAYAAGYYGRVWVRDLANSVQTPHIQAGIKVYPNPVQAGRRLNIELPLGMSETKFSVLDLQGRLLFEGEAQAGKAELTLPEGWQGWVLLRCGAEALKVWIAD